MTIILRTGVSSIEKEKKKAYRTFAYVYFHFMLFLFFNFVRDENVIIFRNIISIPQVNTFLRHCIKLNNKTIVEKFVGTLFGSFINIIYAF